MTMRIQTQRLALSPRGPFGPAAMRFLRGRPPSSRGRWAKLFLAIGLLSNDPPTA